MIKQHHGAKGYKTEELIRKYFLQAGFFVLRGLKLKYESQELTDIDIWIYERSATLARRRTIIDIKDKLKPQAAERLFFALGLSKLIGVEGVGVATKDNQPSLRMLAQKNKVLWINGEDIKRLKESPSLADIQRISEEDFQKLVAIVEKKRGDKNIYKQHDLAKSSMADRFGISSANRCLDNVVQFANEVIRSHPNSETAMVFGRLTFATAAMCAASFDFASVDTALRPKDERRKAIVNAIRYGSDDKIFNARIQWTEDAVSEHAPNGKAIAKTVREGILNSIVGKEAEDLAEIVVQMSHDNRLFNSARHLEMAAYSSNLPNFEQLPIDAQSFLGALLDYSTIERKRFRQSWDINDNINLEIKKPIDNVEKPTLEEHQQKLL